MRFAKIIDETRLVPQDSDDIILVQLMPDPDGEGWGIDFSTHVHDLGIVHAFVKLQEGVKELDVLHGVKAEECRDILMQTIEELRGSINAKGK